jgi:hypothetical protein
MSKYHHIKEGDWTPIPRRGHRNQCCDCASVHDIDYREKDGVLEMRVRINRRATSAARRVFKFKDGK